MKRIILCISLMLFTLASYGQKPSETAIRFLDIPVDGSFRSFANQIERKGFEPVRNYKGQYEYWKVSFNGENVKLYFDEFRDKVYVVFVEFPLMNHKKVKEEYNRIFCLVNDNNKYLPNGLYESIPAEEDIRPIVSKGDKYMVKYAYMSPDHFSYEEAMMLRRIGKKIMTMDPEESESFMEAFKNYMNEVIPENASLEYIESFLKKLESIAYGQLTLWIRKKGFAYQVVMGYINDKNAPSSDGRDL